MLQISCRPFAQFHNEQKCQNNCKSQENSQKYTKYCSGCIFIREIWSNFIFEFRPLYTPLWTPCSGVHSAFNTKTVEPQRYFNCIAVALAEIFKNLCNPYLRPIIQRFPSDEQQIVVYITREITKKSRETDLLFNSCNNRATAEDFPLNKIGLQFVQATAQWSSLIKEKTITEI